MDQKKHIRSGPLTEDELRLKLKDGLGGTFTVPVGTVITPAARDFLKNRKIDLVFGGVQESLASLPPKATGEQEISKPSLGGKSFTGPDGGSFETKPENLTHLYGRQLVKKDHPVIAWRGKLDSFCAAIVQAQVRGQFSANQAYIDDLEEILLFSRSLISAELKGQKVQETRLLGLSVAEIKERSHNPVKYYGYPHMTISYGMGPLCASLNTLRTMVREVELAASRAFGDERDDIILALNRLSSLLYILIFKYLPKGFVPEPSGI